MMCTIKLNMSKNDAARENARDMPMWALKFAAVRATRVRRKSLMRRNRRTSLKRRGTLENPATSLIKGEIHWYGREDSTSVKKEVFRYRRAMTEPRVSSTCAGCYKKTLWEEGLRWMLQKKRCGKRVLHHGARGVLAIEGGPEVEDDVQQEHYVNEKIKVVCPRRFVVDS
jgi:hypothetical protein